ncbi:hypothetical protein H1Q78_05560 [Cellulosimicrobium cellulans]|uniref:hypothetical protein n=1 Tax=Cellulosimicrobium cellulans TaxID=1710 RepID=UPI001EDBCC5C|nr:hypothetical protein [Cellulosimicrobium cellulans]UKJ64852.1 hypothetical protein H1Q78_05560 [Cellulosimicrobium cellulans]
MRSEYRWDLAITHRGSELVEFVDGYFNSDDRRVLLIAGAGFDPRTGLVADLLAGAERASLSGLFVRETRTVSDQDLERLADANLAQLIACVPDHHVIDVEIFGPDNSVVGGRRAAARLNEHALSDYSDVVVDISALSIGVSFPMIRYLIELIHADALRSNLHVMVAHQPELDTTIRSTPTDSAVPIHGFNGGLTLVAGTQEAAKLWLPQLALGRATTLRRIHEAINPDEVCAILPFPASHPRLGDELLEELLGSGGFPWQMDARSIVHADEDDPLDLYRTILRLYTLREPVFREVGGSQLIVSPVGSKVMALGALLAALERDLPVVYLEDFSYELDGSLDDKDEKPELMHVWLEGDPYPTSRPTLRRIDHE